MEADHALVSRCRSSSLLDLVWCVAMGAWSLVLFLIVWVAAGVRWRKLRWEGGCGCRMDRA